MKNPPSFTFYTYSVAGIPPEERWKPTGISDIFFDNLEEARSAVTALREDVAADPEMEWATTVLEKMETIPLDRAAVLALLNHGPRGVVARCEIVETFGGLSQILLVNRVLTITGEIPAPDVVECTDDSECHRRKAEAPVEG